MQVRQALDCQTTESYPIFKFLLVNISGINMFGVAVSPSVNKQCIFSCVEARSHSVQLSLFVRTNSRLSGQEIFLELCNPKYHYSIKIAVLWSIAHVVW